MTPKEKMEMEKQELLNKLLVERFGELATRPESQITENTNT
jgi:hypothetical protein